MPYSTDTNYNLEGVSVDLPDSFYHFYPISPEIPFKSVEDAVIDFYPNPAFIDNVDLNKQLLGWPYWPDPNTYCLFSVPRTSVDTIIKRVQIGTGRGMSQLHLPTPKSELDMEITRGEKQIIPGLIGIYDEKTGFFYSSLCTKGNGPTGVEYPKAYGDAPGAEGRVNKHEPWGLLFDGTTSTIEEPVLDELAALGFKVSRVIGFAKLDREKLIELVNDPEMVTPYNINYELDKIQAP